jgi:hypothetical protein
MEHNPISKSASEAAIIGLMVILPLVGCDTTEHMDNALTALRYAPTNHAERLKVMERVNIDHCPDDFKRAWRQLEGALQGEEELASGNFTQTSWPDYASAVYDLNKVLKRHGYTEGALLQIQMLTPERL